jgi:SnoaL-like domain
LLLLSFILAREGEYTLVLPERIMSMPADGLVCLNTRRRKESSFMAACEQVLLAYVAAWNEANEGKRRTLLETSWAENGTYSDPTAQVAGREALVQHLGRLIEQFADQRVHLTSGVAEHHNLLQFTWVRVGPDGRRIRDGIDFGEVAADGRLLRITGFFGPPPPTPPTFPADLVWQGESPLQE